MKEFEWHQEALDLWSAAGQKGTIEAATGSGKTNFAIKCMKAANPKDVVITVQTIHLQQQWAEELSKHFNPEDVGLVGNGIHQLDKKYIVAIINSVREMALSKDMIVLDESHHGTSPKALEFLRRGMFQKILAISATPERADGAHVELHKHAPVVFRYKQKNAIDDEVLSKYDVISIGLNLEGKEFEEYQKLQSTIENLYPLFNKDHKEVVMGLSGVYGREAAELLKAFNNRRQLLTKAQAKCDYAPMIVLDNSNGELPKTIIFCEFIETAENVLKKMSEFGFPAAIYHSQMSLKVRKQMLEDFKNDKFRIMISARCLDEGINVPEATIAIWISGNSTTRQFIQRLGRILRVKEGKIAKFYQLYISNTIDEGNARKRSKLFNDVARQIEWK